MYHAHTTQHTPHSAHHTTHRTHTNTPSHTQTPTTHHITYTPQHVYHIPHTTYHMPHTNTIIHIHTTYHIHTPHHILHTYHTHTYTVGLCREFFRRTHTPGRTAWIHISQAFPHLVGSDMSSKYGESWSGILLHSPSKLMRSWRTV